MDCRVCGEGTYPFLRVSTDGLDEPFLDGTLREQLPELKLCRCRQCGCLWASDARQSDQLLSEAYARVIETYFDSTENDPRYVQFYRYLEQLAAQHVSGRTILDIGCGEGVFLSSISDEWSKHGLEPSESGADLARRRNLDVARATLDTAPKQYQVDLISALDVIEHVIDPHHFVESFKRHLRPGGVVLLLTGDADSYAARVAGSQWSYLRWCGHISVFSQSGLRKLLQSHGFEVLSWKRCEHPSSPGAKAWWRVHLLEPARRALGRNKSWYPFWRDHQAVVARFKN
ncbi:MAG TPA: class I SAM-dependent methyltransferase [Pyrinomonadaceae bacterium]|nr:class I SAM-dependent methyltransferase [Pyrinomonadaceae bacterium]